MSLFIHNVAYITPEKRQSSYEHCVTKVEEAISFITVAPRP